MKKLIFILLLSSTCFAQIKIKEDYRIGTSVHINVLDGKDKVIYERYVDASKFDTDPKRVAAEIADYLDTEAKKGIPAIINSATAVTISYTKKEIDGEVALMKAGS